MCYIKKSTSHHTYLEIIKLYFINRLLILLFIKHIIKILTKYVEALKIKTVLGN